MSKITIAFLLATAVTCHEFAGTIYCDNGTEIHAFFSDTHVTSPGRAPIDCHDFAGVEECQGGQATIDR